MKKVGFNSYSSQSLFHVANSMYVRNYFDPLSKDATIEMISYIKKAFKEELLDKVKHKIHYEALFTRDIFAHNVAIKIKRY